MLYYQVEKILRVQTPERVRDFVDAWERWPEGAPARKIMAALNDKAVFWERSGFPDQAKECRDAARAIETQAVLIETNQ